MEDLGTRIFRLREANHLSQAELADRIGVSRQTISSWESGRTIPGANMLQEIGKVFGLDINDMFDQKVNNEKYKTRRKYMINSILVVVIILLTTAHLICAFLHLVHFFCVLVCPLFIMFMQLIIFVGFRSSINSNDFTMIAGYKRTDSPQKTTSTLRSIGLLSSIVAVLCESLFTSAYFLEQQRSVSFALSSIYIVFLLIIVLISNKKYSEKG